MLIDGVVKRYPTAVVELDTPYYRGTMKVLRMETPVQDIIIGNIPGARGADVTFDTEHNHDMKCVSDTLTNAQVITYEQNNSGTECSETDDRGPSIKQVESVQTRAMVEKEKRPATSKAIEGRNYIRPGYRTRRTKRKTKVRHDFKEILGPGK